ncbi:phosphatase PAP2 family protein [Streptomyces djakartensis]|uniref:Phosphatase PAP2 family protein n=1 Tax=Streptomyces djakartensis TaxID=68193 RepID=A0ABQ3A9L4_9ACTN|nr:phosphatase PAP2 family protein [Streptomyces djakartensis]GGY37886.1 phosphatase PAP2 family protein [Streptomyces djakartensis]
MHTTSVESPPRPEPRTAARSAGALALCSALLLTLVAARWSPLMSADGDVSATAHRWAVEESAITRACRILTDWVWDPWTMRLVCAVVVVWLVVRLAARWTAAWLALAVTLGSLLQQGLKTAVDRPRPVWPDPVDSAHYAAFPSGHAMTATVVCGLLLWLLHRHGVGRAVWRTALAVSVVSVTGVGLTRVWLGVHWPSDVVGGWLLGALVVALAVWTYEHRQPRTRPDDAAP